MAKGQRRPLRIVVAIGDGAGNPLPHAEVTVVFVTRDANEYLAFLEDHPEAEGFRGLRIEG